MNPTGVLRSLVPSVPGRRRKVGGTKRRFLRSQTLGFLTGLMAVAIEARQRLALTFNTVLPRNDGRVARPDCPRRRKILKDPYYPILVDEV